MTLRRPRGSGREDHRRRRQLKETERVQAGPGPGPRPVRRRHGRPEGQRLQAHRQAAGPPDGARRRTRRSAWSCSPSLSVGLMSLGPRILGRATDLIFAGLIGNDARRQGAGRHDPAAGRRGASSSAGDDKQRLDDRLDGALRRRAGRRLRRRRPRAAARARRVRRRRRCSAWLQGYLLNDVVQGTVLRMRADVEDKVNALPLSYFDQQPRGELLSRVTNDIDNISQTLQQTMSQLLTSLLTVVFVVVHDVLDLAGSSRWSRWSRCRSRWS